MEYSFAFSAIGTDWTVETAAALVPAVRTEILELVADYDAVYSRFRPDSGVARLAAAGGRLDLPDHGAALGRLYSTLYELSDGAVSPLVGDVLADQGYDAAYSLTPKSPTAPARPWDRDSLRWEGNVLTAPRPITVDVGAAGKGQLVDLVASVLDRFGVQYYLVDASGDMRHRGRRPLTVALEHPYDPTRAIGLVPLSEGALCASASNRRAWADGLHHVVDARTGCCVQTVVATWVLAPDAMTADALATALFLMEPEHLASTFDFGYVQVFSDGHARFSTALDGALFPP